jgi:hypothetical protein
MSESGRSFDFGDDQPTPGENVYMPVPSAPAGYMGLPVRPATQGAGFVRDTAATGLPPAYTSPESDNEKSRASKLSAQRRRAAQQQQQQKSAQGSKTPLYDAVGAPLIGGTQKAALAGIGAVGVVAAESEQLVRGAARRTKTALFGDVSSIRSSRSAKDEGSSGTGPIVAEPGSGDEDALSAILAVQWVRVLVGLVLFLLVVLAVLALISYYGHGHVASYLSHVLHKLSHALS